MHYISAIGKAVYKGSPRIIHILILVLVLFRPGTGAGWKGKIYFLLICTRKLVEILYFIIGIQCFGFLILFSLIRTGQDMHFNQGKTFNG